MPDFVQDRLRFSCGDEVEGKAKKEGEEATVLLFEAGSGPVVPFGLARLLT